jgi:hypothetical protein
LVLGVIRRRHSKADVLDVVVIVEDLLAVGQVVVYFVEVLKAAGDQVLLLTKELILSDLRLSGAREGLRSGLDGIPIKGVGGLDHVLIRATAAVLVVLGAVFLVPVPAPHLLLYRLRREDLAALGGSAAVGALEVGLRWVAGVRGVLES